MVGPRGPEGLQGKTGETGRVVGKGERVRREDGREWEKGLEQRFCGCVGR